MVTSEKIAKKPGRLALARDAIRAGATFAKTYRFLAKSQYWSKEQYQAYQLRELRKMLSHAYQNVPYYRQLWQEIGFRPERLSSLADLTSLPWTDKKTLQDNSDTLRATNFALADLSQTTVVGSSGVPFDYYEEKNIAAAREAAFICRLWKRAGFRFGDKRVVLRGKTIPGAEQGKLWNYDKYKRQLTLSSRDLRDENLAKYVRIIFRFRAPFIHAHPSLILMLANYMKQNKIQPFPFMKAILIDSENLYPWLRKILESVFQCRVYSWYGHAEKVVLGGGCEIGNNYHIFPEYGIIELLDKNGNVIMREDEPGENVATGFNNPVTPLIRYRTMDIGVYSHKRCPCGRNYPILKRLDGSLYDYMVANDGSLVSLTSLIFAHNIEAFSKIRQIQIVQEAQGNISVRIIRMIEYSKIDEEEIKKTMLNGSQGKLGIVFDYVDDIPGAESGKPRFLIQKLSLDKYFQNSTISKGEQSCHESRQNQLVGSLK